MKTFREVGVDCGLEGKTLERYVKYMTKRWKDEEETQCLTGYAGEWARRFRSRVEWYSSDSEGQQVLMAIDNAPN